VVLAIGQLALENTERDMSDKRYLPRWLHRVFSGLFSGALLAGFGTCWLGDPEGSWRHVVSLCLLWSSVAIGIVFAAITHRFSIVEGLAGEVGDEEDETERPETVGLL
jgi:hypothetical protein